MAAARLTPLPRRAAELEGCTLDGRFEIESLLDEGGMALVYEGIDNQSGAPVAVKVLRDDVARHPEMRQRFRNEAYVTMGLVSRHVVEIVAVGESDGDGPAYYVMELLDGTPLADLCGEQCDIDLVIDGARQLCSGLQVAHEKGVVHRDLKPENIIVVHEDGQPVFKIIDFGVAKVSLGATLTGPGAVIGTPHYMAPEQASGKHPITPATDVYALGSILYELVAGDVPFPGHDGMQVILAQLGATPKPVLTRRPDCPLALALLIERCLAKRPDERFPSACAMRGALDELAGDAPTAAEPTCAEASGMRLRSTAVTLPALDVLVATEDPSIEVEEIVDELSGERAVVVEMAREEVPELEPPSLASSPRLRPAQIVAFLISLLMVGLALSYL